MHLKLLQRAVDRSEGAFEASMRPVLMPNETMADAASWKHNSRCGLRGQLLHGAETAGAAALGCALNEDSG